MNFEGLVLVLRYEHPEHGEMITVYEVKGQTFTHTSSAASLAAEDVQAWLRAGHYQRIIDFDPDDRISGLYQRQA